MTIQKCKHFSEIIPDKSQLRNNYVAIIYKKVMNEFRINIGNNAIRISAGERIGMCDHSVVHLICGKIDCHSHRVHGNVEYFYVARFINDFL